MVGLIGPTRASPGLQRHDWVTASASSVDAGREDGRSPTSPKDSLFGLPTPPVPAPTGRTPRFYRILPPAEHPAGQRETPSVKGYVVRKGNQYYAVIYEGLDPITGREHRRWQPAGPDRELAEALAHRLADDRLRDRSPYRSSLTVGVYLTQRWLPANQARLRPSTWAGYDRNVRLHIVPRIGRVPLRHLRPDHIERLYAALSAEGNHVRSGGLDAKTILEIHQVLRRSLDDAVRRGLIVTNPAQVAHAPRRRPLGSSVARAWNAQQLREFLDHIGDHRFFAALWVSANTGLRRGELAGLHWGDIDLDERRLSVSRSLVSVGYELHESRGRPARHVAASTSTRPQSGCCANGRTAALTRTRTSTAPIRRRTSSLEPTAHPPTPTSCPTRTRSWSSDRDSPAFDCTI
jgi:integrase